MKSINYINILLVLFFLAGCKNNPPVLPPSKATLIFPEKNSACVTGAIISDSQSSITFTWNSADHADKYTLQLKNLLTGLITTKTVTNNQLTDTLLRNTPYSWFVRAKSNSSPITSQSDTWRFYNSGLGVNSHPPFPADNLSPALGAVATVVSAKINLTWTTADPDNDITGYDVYFGTTTTPASIKTNITTTFVNDIAVVSGTKYYWKVITKDAAGNTSDSGLFQFTVN